MEDGENKMGDSKGSGGKPKAIDGTLQELTRVLMETASTRIRELIAKELVKQLDAVPAAKEFIDQCKRELAQAKEPRPIEPVISLKLQEFLSRFDNPEPDSPESRYLNERDAKEFIDERLKSQPITCEFKTVDPTNPLDLIGPSRDKQVYVFYAKDSPAVHHGIDYFVAMDVLEAAAMINRKLQGYKMILIIQGRRLKNWTDPYSFGEITYAAQADIRKEIPMSDSTLSELKEQVRALTFRNQVLCEENKSLTPSGDAISGKTHREMMKDRKELIDELRGTIVILRADLRRKQEVVRDLNMRLEIALDCKDQQPELLTSPLKEIETPKKTIKNLTFQEDEVAELRSTVASLRTALRNAEERSSEWAKGVDAARADLQKANAREMEIRKIMK